MIYKKFKDESISGFALGTMRLPQVSDKPGDIDEKQVFEMIDYAMSKGVNYYDTAWGYHDGMSEIVVGKALSKYNREDFYLADKFPGYDLNNMDKVEEIFEKQLEKCQVDYFDFYLIHNVCELNIREYLDPKYGIRDYLRKQVKNGRIKHLGFSIHGSMQVLEDFLMYYGEDIEFGQVQINYIDWKFQEADKIVQRLKELGIGVWVMEPLRGGRLVDLGETYNDELKNMRPDEEVVDWAYRFLQSIDEVVTVLSGSSNIEQLKHNIEVFETEKPLNADERKRIIEIAGEMTDPNSVPCTTCRYCTSHCPNGLDIPHLINLYNEEKFTEGGFIAPMALDAIEDGKKPKDCIACGKCEIVCPQQIKISEVMKEFTELLKSNPMA